MRKRTTAASKRQQKQRNSAVRNVIIVVLAVSLIAVLYVRTVLGRRSLDEVTLCPASPDSITVLLVDVTDPMTLPQKQDFRNQLDRLISEIPRYGKLVITKVDPVSDRLLTPIVTRCNPGTGSDTNELVGNKKKLEKLHQEQFIAPLQDAYDRILSASDASRSPILESIQSINLTELASDQSAGIRKRLIVASDLLQNTDDLSFYKHIPEPASILKNQAFSRVRTDLRGVDVDLRHVIHDDGDAPSLFII